MKILIISPGAGESFYCGNCFRDSLQASALIKAGHDVTVLPLYLPSSHARKDTPVFFPAVRYYLEQVFFRDGNIPKWLSTFTSSRLWMNIASSMSGTTSAEGTEGMTLSMINGDDGAFRKNLLEMVEWVRKDGVPDIIHLTSSLLVGLAKPLKEEFGVPVVCFLQDEDVWIDSLKKGFVDRAWKDIISHGGDVDALMTTSKYYLDVVTKKAPQYTPEVIYPGLDIEKYRCPSLPQDPTIGFFYRMNDLDGLDILARAFVILKKKGDIPNLKLRVGGGYSGSDRKFLGKVRRILRPYMDDVTFEQDYSPLTHHLFYKEITVLSVPLRFNEGAGLYICEAFATGRPVVEPRRGSFPEIVGGGGLLYKDNTPNELAEALDKILSNHSLFVSRRDEAIRLAENRYRDIDAARKLVEVYTSAIERYNSGESSRS